MAWCLCSPWSDVPVCERCRVQWGIEEGVLDLGLLVVLFCETCSMMFCAGVTALKDSPWHWGWHLYVCLETRDSPILGSAGYRGVRLTNALEIRPEPRTGPGPGCREVA